MTFGGSFLMGLWKSLWKSLGGNVIFTTVCCKNYIFFREDLTNPLDLWCFGWYNRAYKRTQRD